MHTDNNLFLSSAEGCEETEGRNHHFKDRGKDADEQHLEPVQRSREKALQLGGKEKNAVFMSLGQRKFSFVHRKHGISLMHIDNKKESLCVVDE